MDESEELKQARQKLDAALGKGTVIDQQEVQDFWAVGTAISQMHGLSQYQPSEAYGIGLAALQHTRCLPQQRAELRRLLGCIGLELGQVHAAMDHLFEYQEWARQTKDPLLELYSDWWITVGLRYVAELGMTIDGIVSPVAQFQQVLSQMAELHAKSRNHLDQYYGRFVFVASAVDRVPILYHFPDRTSDDVATATADLDEALKLIKEHADELGYLRGHALKSQALLAALAGDKSSIVELLEVAAHDSPPGSLKRGQAMSSLGQAYLEKEHYVDAHDAFEEAYGTLVAIAQGLGSSVDRLLFGDQVGSVIRGLASAKLGLIRTGEDEQQTQKLLAELRTTLDWTSNSELSRFLLTTYEVGKEPALSGSALLEVLQRFEQVSERKTRLCYLYADQAGTHRFQVKSDGAMSLSGPLNVTRKEWAELWQCMANSYAPISRQGNPARPQDYLKRSEFPARWSELGDKLAQYILLDDAAGEHIYLVLDEWLCRLPIWSAAIGGDPLFEFCTVSVVPSVMALISIASLREKPPLRYVAIGTGTKADFLRRKDYPESLAMFHSIGDHLVSEGVLTADNNLSWEAATITAFEQKLSQCQAGFVTAHAVFDSERGLQSGLYLADKNGLPDPERPNLAAASIGELALETDLLVLNACVVGIERRRGMGEGLGLSWALYRAGVRSHVAALWPVYQAAGNYFACRLYDYLEGGAKTYADAFRVAMKETRAQYPNHYHWATFSLRGIGMSTYQ